MFRQLSMLLLASAAALLSALAQAETLNVHLVLSDSTAPYQQFSTALNKALAASKANVAIIEKHASRKPLKAASAIYLDQPWERQLNFIQAALPKHSIVGILYSPNIPIVL